jgi:two-component system, cell cycle sensor histidine kinase and response regulator CckA
LKTIFDRCPFGVAVIGRDRKVRWANQYVCKLAGVEDAAVLCGKLCGEYFCPASQTECPILDRHQGVDNSERIFRRRDGLEIPILKTVLEIEINGEPVLLETFEDITERKRAEEALKFSLSLLDAALESSADGLLIVNSNGMVAKYNQKFAKMWKIPEDGIAGADDDELLNHVMTQVADPRQFLARVRDIYTKPLESSSDLLALLDGRVIERYSQPQKIGDQVVGRVWSFRDITERKWAEEALRESEEKFRLTFDFSPDAVNINRLEDGMCVDINEGFIQATGYSREEIIGKTSLEISIWHNPDDREKLVQGLREKGFYENLEARFRRKDGSLITALMSARVISLRGIPHIISITRDITERKLIETKLQQVQKFEAIGTLAGGIAHDFNNLLMGIQGRASLMSMEMETSHPYREHIQAIEEYIRSAANLTKQLLGFARGGKYEVIPVDMNKLLLGSSSMFGRTKKEIRIHAKCQQSPIVVDADRGQIEQVLLNMYVNAWQAMPPEGGDLYLETMIVTLDAAYCRPHRAKPGRYVKVSITDTGAGMDETTRLQAFDPFFTTKEKSRGTGLGLASAYGIIKNHGGMITVYSEIGHGTTFNIYLPVSEKNSQQEIPLEKKLIKGSATILLVDDEEMIIDVGQAILERLGYRVVVCRGGQEAVKTITGRGNEIDLVILDMIMPGMDGGTTFDRIRNIRPEMPVLLSSGYAINGQAHEIMRRGCNGFIQKPYNISELSDKVRNVLDGK